jgi:hypothetical protein
MSRITRLALAATRRILPFVAVAAGLAAPLCTTGGGFPIRW